MRFGCGFSPGIRTFCANDRFLTYLPSSTGKGKGKRKAGARDGDGDVISEKAESIRARDLRLKGADALVYTCAARLGLRPMVLRLIWSNQYGKVCFLTEVMGGTKPRLVRVSIFSSVEDIVERAKFHGRYFARRVLFCCVPTTPLP